MKLFSKDIMIAATVYVVAETEEEARKKYDALKDKGLEFSSCEQEIGDDIVMTGESYSADMPEVSLSPAMMIHGPFPDDTGGMELVEAELTGDTEHCSRCGDEFPEDELDEEGECGQCQADEEEANG